MKRIDFTLLVAGIVLVSAASVLLVVGAITLYYANLGRNALDYIVLSKNQIDTLNFEYYLGMTELISGLVIEGVAAVLLVIRRYILQPHNDIDSELDVLGK